MVCKEPIFQFMYFFIDAVHNKIIDLVNFMIHFLDLGIHEKSFSIQPYRNLLIFLRYSYYGNLKRIVCLQSDIRFLIDKLWKDLNDAYNKGITL